jgi:LysM repeat protein
MGIKFGIAAFIGVLLIFAVQGYIFGGGDDPSSPLSRPGSIPTATPPANLPEPVVLGEVRGSTTSAATAGGGAGSYTVKSNDTLAGIAIQLGVPADGQAAWIAEVLRLNGLADARLLTVGQVLQLPRTATPAAGAAASPTPVRTPTIAPTATSPAATPTPTVAVAAATPTPTSTAVPVPSVPVTGGGGTYTVVSGDYPILIAEKLGVPVAQQDAWAQQLLALNATCSSCLQVGQILQLPANTP